MIEKVSKYLFVTFHKEYEEFLLRLRSLGVVHIQPSRSIKEIEELQGMVAQRKELADLLRSLMRLRSKDAPKVEPKEITSMEQGLAVMREVQGLNERLSALQQEIASQKRENDYWEIWGDYSLASIARLEQAGYPVAFYSCSAQQYNPEWETEFNAVPVNNHRSHIYFLTVGNNTGRKPDAEPVKAPEMEQEQLAAELTRLEKEQEEAQQALQEFVDNRMGEPEGFATYLDNRFNFSNAMAQAIPEADSKVMVLEGWVSTSDEKKLLQDLENEPCYVVPSEITDEDNIPIKLKNNSFSRLFEPITKMYSLPNYSEIDVTVFFAPFFVLFFSLCLGDAGYAFLVFLAATLLKRKAKDSGFRDICGLGQWLGGVATVVDLVLGTVFGMAMPWTWGKDGGLLVGVGSDYILNQNNLMVLSIIIGLLQIVFGKLLAGVKVQKQRGFKYALGQYGWVLIIASLLVAVGLPLLGIALPQWLIYGLYGLAGIGALFAFFYNTPGKNIILNFGSGLWATYNNASGLLGDTLSYIRLFAIGLTGGILGGVFNNLAVDMTKDMPPVVNILVMSLILLFGHSLNFGLSMISSLVHPLRLTFVEFYKNSEFEGGGKIFTPFKLNK